MKIVQKFNRLFMIMALGTALVSTTSCKDDDPVAQPQTINDIVNTNADFTILKAAVSKAGLNAALSTGTLTVFAPDDAAFAASGVTLATINSLSAADLANILTYHVVAANVTAANVPASDTVKSLQGKNLYASKNANGVFVNGSRVKTADIAAANGTIHVISSMLTPPTQTIAEIATATPELSLLLTAVVKANLATAVSSAGKYTVFAPTNAAFAAAGFPDAASINAAPDATIAAVVSAHVLGTNVFASDLINAATVSTIASGVTLTVGTSPATVKITGSASDVSNIIVPAGVNIIATNGVVHLIDRVLL